MPYIRQEDRNALAMGSPVATTGDLNYKVTLLVNAWLHQWGLNYANINAAIGALEAAKLELYRRVAAPYENQKIMDNGDVYNSELTGGQK